MAAKVETIYIEIQTPLLLNTRQEHDTILDLWTTYLPEYLPDRYGNSEPIDRVFDLSKREEILAHFRWPFLAVKEKPKLDTSIWMRSPKKHLHSSWKLSFTFGEGDVGRLISFLRAAAQELEADFCCLTLFTDAEIDFGRRNRTAWNLDKKATRFFFAIHSQFLQQCLPDVYWLTIFGPPYVEFFGKERIISAPVTQSEVIDQKMVLMQLTPRLEDVRDAPKFRDLKSRIKTHLGADAFYQPGQVGQMRHPQFSWETEPGIK